jgi:hypothetical protein
MAVTAGIVGDPFMTAGVTDIDMAAKTGSTASFDRFHGFKLMKRERMVLAILRTESGENIL